jgi:hypothetical protein
MKKVLTICALLFWALPAWAVRPVQITTKSIASIQISVPYSKAVMAKYGTKPYTWSIGSGSLPFGLSINASTGVISGTPSVSGSYSFVVHIADNASTVDNRSYNMSVIGGSPIISVSIITTSLPSGTNGVAYSANVQAANGTAPYTWSISSGTLPPGVALDTSTGALTGTPTASGSYSPTFKVTDANSGTSSRAYAVSIAAGTPTYLFSDDLSSFAAWSSKWDSTHTVIASCPGGGNCAQMHYVMCGDSANPACGSAHQDVDYFVEKFLAATDPIVTASEIWSRGYFYIKTPEAGADPHMQRKLFYFTAGCFGCSVFPSGDPWSMFVAATEYSTSLPGAGPLKLKWSLQNGPIGGSTFVIDCGSTNPPTPITGIGCALQYDTFYSLEMRTKYNTNAVAPFNGEVQIWIDGTSVLNITGWSLNRDTSYHLRDFRYGEQVDRLNYLPADEYRYWKNVIINNAYIGP